MNYRQLTLGIVCMILISNLQYGWTLFVLPLDDVHHWGRPTIQAAYALFIAAQSWSFPFLGVFVDRNGPRRVGMLGGVFIGAGWVANAFASSVAMLYAGELVAGLGTGLVLSAVYGSALKTESRRGLVIGLTSAGYGVGSALTVSPLAWVISAYGYQTAFLGFGLVQGIAVVTLAHYFVTPRQIAESARVHTDHKPLNAVLSPAFLVMYLMFALVAAGGLLATAQLAPIAHDYGVASTPVSFMGVSMTALVFALSLDRITNGASRPFFGWLSDGIGREATMCIAFGLEGLAVLGLLHFAHDPVLFVVFSGLTFFAWGEIFSLFPALCTDIFGRTFGATNYGLLYTAKGVAGFFVPWASALMANEHWGWEGVLYLVVIFDFAAALLAVTAILPLRLRMRTA